MQTSATTYKLYVLDSLSRTMFGGDMSPYSVSGAKPQPRKVFLDIIGAYRPIRERWMPTPMQPKCSATNTVTNTCWYSIQCLVLFSCKVVSVISVNVYDTSGTLHLFHPRVWKSQFRTTVTVYLQYNVEVLRESLCYFSVICPKSGGYA